MAEHNASGLAWVPTACILPTAEQPLRAAEFDALLTAAVGSAERLGPQHLRLMLAGDAGLEASVRDLAARETGCCSFFTFTVSVPRPGQVQLDIEVPKGHVDILDAWQARSSVV